MAIHNHGNEVFIDRDENEFTLRNFGAFRSTAAPPDVRFRSASTQTDWQLFRPLWQLDNAAGVIRITRVAGRIRINREWSWVWQPHSQDRRLLAHEQGHYRISYVVLLQLLQRLKGFTVPLRSLPQGAPSSTQAQRDTVADAILAQFEPTRLQAVRRQGTINGWYDAQSSHGTAAGFQEQWNRILNEGLRGTYDRMIRLDAVI